MFSRRNIYPLGLLCSNYDVIYTLFWRYGGLFNNLFILRSTDSDLEAFSHNPADIAVACCRVNFYTNSVVVFYHVDLSDYQETYRINKSL